MRPWRALPGLVVLIVALVSLPPSRASAQAEQAQQVTLNFLTQGEPDTLDPNRASLANAVNGAVVRQVFEPLLRFDERLVPQPAAAESYDLSADGTTYTFHLRSDGRWSDGRVVTAGDFEYSWKRLLAQGNQSEYSMLFAAAGIADVTALDDLTFRVRLNQPFAALPDLAALWMGVPLRSDLVAANPDAWATDPATYIGNGPFMLSEWAHQDHLTLVPNPRYVAHLSWPAPSLTRITVQMQTSPQAAFAAYTSGDAPDWLQVSDFDANAALNDPNLAPQARRLTELTTFWLQINNARAPLNNALVRRALSKGIDRATLVRDLATGVSAPTTSLLPPGMPGFQDDAGRDLGFDPSGARALLAEAGYDGSNALPPLTFTFPSTASNLRRAQYFQNQLSSSLGIELNLQGMDATSYEQALDSGNYQLAFGGWSADYPDPRDWFGPAFGCEATLNKLNYCNPRLDRLVAQADTGGGLTDRLPVYGQAQSLLLQDAPVAPLFNRGRLVLVKPWVQSTDGAPLRLTPLDDYPGSLFLDKVRILPH